MSKKEDYIELFHDYGPYLPTKTCDIFGEITEELSDKTLKNLHILDSTTGLVSARLKSEGGSVVEARAMYDAIKDMKNHIRIVCHGYAESAASLILQAADERIMKENSHLMLHVGEHSMPANHPRNIDRLKEFYDELELWMENVYLVRIKEKRKRFTRSQLKALLQFDKYIFPKEAMDLGLIDKIGEVQ